jgi:hypothetical protein
MFTRKGLTLALAALFFATIIVSGTMLPGLAGGGPANPPYPFKAVGPEMNGSVTLVPGKDNMSLKAAMSATCGTNKAKLDYDFKTQKTADTLTDAEITASATNYFLQAGTVVMKPIKACAPASGAGDLVVLGITDLKVQRVQGKIKKIEGKAKLTFIAPQ